MSTTAPETQAEIKTFREWYLSQYVSTVGLRDVEGGAKFRRFVKSLPRPSITDEYPLSGVTRMADFIAMRVRYPLGASGYTCAAVEVRVKSGGREQRAHVAYAYWRRGTESKDPEYICVSPTFDSRDGEYRRRFIPYRAFTEACDIAINALKPYEQAIIDIVTNGQLRTAVTVYSGSAGAGIEIADTVSDRANALCLAVVAPAVAVALDLWEYEAGLLMEHTNAAYRTFIHTVAESHPELVRQALAGSVTDMFTWGIPGTDIQCGQKLVPLTNREAMQPSDCNLSAWRELEVSHLAGDLVINRVAPSFAMYNQWTYIESADATLFENAAMGERYARGSVVEEAAGDLRDARRALKEGLNGPEAPSNWHTSELDAQVYESLEYAQSYLLMSPIAMLHTMEDVGWALRSVGTYARRAVRPPAAAVEAFATPDAVARFLFEIAYGAHCLHRVLGVAHTDLHGNNMTLHMWARSTASKREASAPPYYADPVVAYVAGPRGEADTYVFPASGASGCVIDFSRCCLGPSFRPRLEAGRGERYAVHFYRDQVNRVMRALHRYAPALVAKHEAAIKAAVLADYDAAFPVLCCIDFIAAGRSCAAALRDAAAAAESTEKRPFIVAAEGIQLAERLEQDAMELFITGLMDLVEGRGHSAAERHEVPFPGDQLLSRVFSNWAYPKWAARPAASKRGPQLVDAYNILNAQGGLKYSSSDYARWPPWARLDEIERHLGGLSMRDLFERGTEPFLAALRGVSRQAEVVAERVRAEQEKLDGAAVSTASSWID